jgi:acetolactate synthase-1/2/3 large subunit
MKTGAQALLDSLAASGIDLCLANPGTSEMQLVAAIGNTPAVRGVLCLFEGVVTGAADGYARMAERPAATLLHLGSGLSNGLANLHNARRAGSPVVNIVGDHASYHLQYDAPLTSDLPGLADWGSHWFRVAEGADSLPELGTRAVQAAREGNGRIATLVVPADSAWTPCHARSPQPLTPAAKAVDAAHIESLAEALADDRPRAFFLGGRALRADNLERLAAIAGACGARLLCQTFPARLQRGAGRVPVERLPYFAEQASATLAGLEQLILVGSAAPVSFFAYPDKASWLAPEHCELITLATAEEDIDTALSALAERLGAAPASLPDVPPGPALPEAEALDAPLTLETVGRGIAALMPEDSIVVDEGVTSGLWVYLLTEGAATHDWLTLTGGAIGQGLPVALGASLACPQRKVVALQADGSALYTLQALWSMARENCDVTVVLFNNRQYAILAIEVERVGVQDMSERGRALLDLSNPDMDFCALAEGLGVRAHRAQTGADFVRLFGEAMATPGPHFIEAIL